MCRKERTRFFMGGCGCATLVLGLLVACLFLVFTRLGGTGMSGNPLNRIGTQVFPSGSNTVLVTPSLMPVRTTPAPVGSPLMNAQAGTPVANPVSSDYLNQLYRTVSPGVVSIYVTINNNGQTGEAAGSGFLFDTSGDIVTNNHVVQGANLVVVRFQDGSEEEAKIVGTDPYSDLAVVKVGQLPQNSQVLPLGDSDMVRTGDWAVAIGNPFGLNSSMSIGIISAVGRSIPSLAASYSIPMAIQTDAAINPGNSGGPLLNLQGQVIGVNAQIAAGSGGANAGVGFSIPSNIVRRVVPTLIDVGVFQWPWLGIEGTDMNMFIARANGLSVARGAYIVQTVPGGPAEQAGLQGGDSSTNVDGIDTPTGGDVITAVDGTSIGNYTDLLALISQKDPGATVQLTILRHGQQQTVPVTLGPRPVS